MKHTMTITRRIALGFGAMTFLLFLAVSLTLWEVRQTQLATTEVIQVRAPRAQFLAELLNGINHSIAANRGYLIFKSDKFKEQFEIAWKDQIERSLSNLRAVAIDAESKLKLQEIEANISEFRVNEENVNLLIGKVDNQPAHKIWNERLLPNFDRISERLSSIYELERQQVATAERKELLATIGDLRYFVQNARGEVRAYLIEPNQKSIDQFKQFWRSTERGLTDLRTGKALLTSDQIHELDKVDAAREDVEATASEIFLIRGGSGWDKATALMEERSVPLSFQLRALIGKLIVTEQEFGRAAEDEALGRTARLQTLEWILLFTGIILSAGLGIVITRNIGRRISEQTRELLVAAEQLQEASLGQSQGVTEQTAATSEIAATMAEFAVMAKGVVQRCQEVTALADQALISCNSGGNAVGEAQAVMSEIKGQVEKIVQHMLDLGKKSQQINIATDIIRELSDQTTILSFNAAIEAAAAGQAGQSFAIVADQVGKLADRAKTAAKEVKALVDEIQRSTNTTIMATEDALKAAGRGLVTQQQAYDVVSGVSGKMTLTLEAAREIELSSGQQCTAAEQVKEGIDNILAATRLAERSSSDVASGAKMVTSSAQRLEQM